MGSRSASIWHLVDEEIRRFVAGALSRNRVLSAPEIAARILETYPNCGLEKEAVANQVMMVAARAGVAVEIGGRGAPAHSSDAATPQSFNVESLGAIGAHR